MESDPPTSLTDSCTCAHQPGSLPLNSSVSWCYETSADHITGIGDVTLCINVTGHRDVSYSIGETPLLTNHIRNISVLDDGQLHLPAVSFSLLLRHADITCTVFSEDGDQLQPCDVGFYALDREKSKPIAVAREGSGAKDGTHPILARPVHHMTK